MTELLTAAQMRAIEDTAIRAGGVTGRDLMERAGQGVIAAIWRHWPELACGPQRAVVLCGPGNNGGDGFVVARLLRQRGWMVDLYLLGDPARLPPDARANHDLWLGLGPVLPMPCAELPRLRQNEAGLLVDALFGTGLTRGLAPELAQIAPDQPGWHRVAVDVPSGLCADSGRVLQVAPGRAGAVLRADLTVSFHHAKLGHYLQDGPQLCGALVVADIGLDPAETGQAVSLVDAEHLARRAVPALRKAAVGHKYVHGHALVLSGGPGRGGAARLAARAALRTGAGLVTLGCPPAALAENAARLDAVMLRPVGDAAELGDILADPRISALCLGPGLGLEDAAQGLLETALRSGRPIVLDADALTLIARNPSLAGVLHPSCVLTPHWGEFARLFSDLAAHLAADPIVGPAVSRLDVVRQAAARLGCTVLLKGADTVICGAAGQAALHGALYGNVAPWLATAGSGDVLAGFIAGLLARGFAGPLAAATAVWLHAACGRNFGPGLIAEDLPEVLPKVLRGLGV